MYFSHYANASNASPVRMADIGWYFVKPIPFTIAGPPRREWPAVRPPPGWKGQRPQGGQGRRRALRDRGSPPWPGAGAPGGTTLFASVFILFYFFLSLKNIDFWINPAINGSKKGPADWEHNLPAVELVKIQLLSDRALHGFDFCHGALFMAHQPWE